MVHYTPCDSGHTTVAIMLLCCYGRSVVFNFQPMKFQVSNQSACKSCVQGILITDQMRKFIFLSYYVYIDYDKHNKTQKGHNTLRESIKHSQQK